LLRAAVRDFVLSLTYYNTTISGVILDETVPFFTKSLLSFANSSPPHHHQQQHHNNTAAAVVVGGVRLVSTSPAIYIKQKQKQEVRNINFNFYIATPRDERVNRCCSLQSQPMGSGF
jgi:hypothetical protein